VEIEPPIKKYYVELEKASLTDPLADQERLLKALFKDHKIKGLEIDFITLRTLPDILREGDWKIRYWQSIP
jgi:uncharacterized 2Fe-2S/4Fe-4S cluster protein (DUF4445 family)